MMRPDIIIGVLFLASILEIFILIEIADYRKQLTVWGIRLLTILLLPGAIWILLIGLILCICTKEDREEIPKAFKKWWYQDDV